MKNDLNLNCGRYQITGVSSGRTGRNFRKYINVHEYIYVKAKLHIEKTHAYDDKLDLEQKAGKLNI